MEPTASLILIAQPSGAAAFNLKIEIGKPSRADGPTGNWACPVSLQPLHDRLHDIHGADALQALCLAVSFVLRRLHSFVDDGGTLTTESGAAFDPASYMIGVVQTPPPSV